MQRTKSYESVIPPRVLHRYDFAETRNAAAILRVTSPEAFDDVVSVLQGFRLTADKLTTPGGSKSVIARELDDAFRHLGWREARFDQVLETRLTVFRWSDAPKPELEQTVTHVNEYGGHKVDNVRGRAALDVRVES